MPVVSMDSICYLRQLPFPMSAMFLHKIPEPASTVHLKTNRHSHPQNFEGHTTWRLVATVANWQACGMTL